MLKRFPSPRRHPLLDVLKTGGFETGLVLINQMCGSVGAVDFSAFLDGFETSLAFVVHTETAVAVS